MPAGSGILVVYPTQQVDDAEALSWFSQLLSAAIGGPVIITPIGLWADTDRFVRQLCEADIEVSVLKIRRAEYVRVQGKTSNELREALKIMWPQAEALACHKLIPEDQELRILELITKSHDAYEGRYGPHLPVYKLVAFMESGRASVEFMGEQGPLRKALDIALDLAEKSDTWS